MDEKLIRDLETSCGKIKNNALWKMTRSNEANRLKRQIAENKKLYFDPKDDPHFQISYWYTDENKEEQVGYKFDEHRYAKYKDFMKNYDKNYSTLIDKKQKLFEGFALFKERKLKKINVEIEYYHKLYQLYRGFERKEAISNKAKIENEIYEDRLKKMEQEFIRFEIEQMFIDHPDYINIEFSPVKIDAATYVNILKCQNRLREEKNKQSQSNANQNVQERDM